MSNVGLNEPSPVVRKDMSVSQLKLLEDADKNSRLEFNGDVLHRERFVTHTETIQSTA